VPSGARIMVNQGGTRSGKTYSILQSLIELAMRTHEFGMRPLIITVCRKAMPSLRGTAMRDFIEILEALGLYSERNHNKSSAEYNLRGTIFEFIGIDQPQKVRGRKRDILFVNEGNELTFEDWRQLVMRTNDKIIIDFNPSEEYHWLYDFIMPRKDARTYITTYLDNPFLSREIVSEIERLKEEDENYWNIYGLGQRGVSGTTIYSNWKQCEAKEVVGRTIYGLDFGFNNPTAIAKCVRTDIGMYAEQVLYQSYLTNQDLIKVMSQLLPNKRVDIRADAADPDRIEEIRRAGFNIKPANKAVKTGIDKCRSVPLEICGVDAVKEIRNYKYKVDANGIVQEEPVKVNDHFVDAMRYAGIELISDRKLSAPRSTVV